MESLAKLSVIIPVYKVEHYLRQCLDSVVNQTYKNLEIILIDDGSPDNCGKICDEYAKRDERIIVIHKENGGLSAARNDGILIATGDWITFVDSDDWCELDYYEKIIIGMKDNQADIVCTGARIKETDSGSEINIALQNDCIANAPASIEDLQTKILAFKGSPYCIGAPWDKLYRRDFIQTKGLLFDTSSRAWEDLWFNFQAFHQAKIVSVHVVVGYHYRIHTASITGGYNPKRPEINYDFLRKLWCYTLDHHMSDAVKAAINARAIALILNTMQLYFFNPNNDKTSHEVIEEFKQMIKWPYYADAIQEKHNPHLTYKLRVLRILLRMNMVTLVKVLYLMKKMNKKDGERKVHILQLYI